MKLFDQEWTRRDLDGSVGYRWMLSRDFERSRAVGGLASSAEGYLNMAVRCLLVGYDEPARALAQRAEQWLCVAISDNERPRVYAPFGAEAHRHLCLAQARWLLHAVQDVEQFRAFVTNQDRFLDELPASASDVSLAAPQYLDGLAYAEAIRMLERFGFSVPASLAAIQTEAEACYAMSLHELEGRYSNEELLGALERFLGRSVNAWLTKGQAIRAAEWMKIVHWNPLPRALSPKEVVNKCYMYLPHSVRKP